MIRHTLITLAIIPLVMIIYLSIPGDMSTAEIKEAYNNLNTQTIASEFDEDSYKEAVKEVSDKVNSKGIYLFPIRIFNGYRGDATEASNVGYRSNATPNFHNGVDINVGGSDDTISEKNSQVLAATDGVIYKIANNLGAVYISDSEGRIFCYMHMIVSSYSNLKVGDAIKQGDVIGKIGRTGASNMHLHYQVTVKGTYGSPLNIWDFSPVENKKVVGKDKKLGTPVKYYCDNSITSYTWVSGGEENDTAMFTKDNFVPNPKTGHLPVIKPKGSN